MHLKKQDGPAKEMNEEEIARALLEKLLWPVGPVCPHCHAVADSTRLHPDAAAETHGRDGLHQCRHCRRQFTVTIGTILGDSKIPIHKWLFAIRLMCFARKPVTASQLQRELELGSYRSAWAMCNRIRWTMTQSPLCDALGGGARDKRAVLRIPFPPDRALRLMLAVKPTAAMPRPGAHRQKSLLDESNEEFGPAGGARNRTRASAQ